MINYSEYLITVSKITVSSAIKKKKGVRMNAHLMNSHALYYVKPDEKGNLITQTGEELDLNKYSRFKHGSGKDASDYGISLAQSLVKAHPDLFSGEFDLAIAAAPYRTVPKGAQGIANALLDYLNTKVLVGYLPKAVMVKITAENQPSDTDYSALSGAERAIRNDHVMFSIRQEDFKGRFLLIVDDTRITGGTEGKILRVLEQLDPPPPTMMLYVAHLDPESAKADPRIEDRMNTTYVKNLSQQAEIIAAGGYLLNPRCIQFILNPKNIGDVKTFCESIDLPTLTKIRDGIITDEYHSRERYIPSFKILDQVYRNRISQDKEQ